MSYTIDVYRARARAGRACSTSRCSELLPAARRRPDRARQRVPAAAAGRAAARRRRTSARCLALILWSATSRRRAIADNLAQRWSIRCSPTPAAHGAATCCSPRCGYSVQIYCDFSGYTDMAIAVAGLLGFALAQNFDAPYLRHEHPASSGGAGTSACRPGCATTCTSRSAATAAAPARTYREPDDHDAARRAVARRQLDLRGVGRRATALRAGRAPPWPSLLPRRAPRRAAAPACAVLELGGHACAGSSPASRCSAATASQTFGALLRASSLARGRRARHAALVAARAARRAARRHLLRARACSSGVPRAAPALGYAFLLGVAASVLLFFTPVSSAPFIYFQF